MRTQKSGGCCGPLVLLALTIIVLFLVVFAAPQIPANKPAPQWYQTIYKLVHDGTPIVKQSGVTHSSSASVSHLASPSGSCFDLARVAAVQAGIDPMLYARQINEESGCTNVTSPAGARGVAQLMPEMAMSLGVDASNMWQSLQAGAHLMAGYLKMHGGSWALALACYNAGSGAVSQALANYGADWYAHIPAETQRYITAILGSGV
ncbi:MAG: transglycosylase SLT domain-containing protein [Chloroflexota bacterium]|nr:transglycosylase SLT domain-containing protein [Chloroflexota bacterium]